MSAETHLAKFGVTVQNAFDFIVAHVDQPEIIFNAADQFAITTEMLAEITNISTDVITQYFAEFNLDTRELDDTHILISTEPGTLGSLVDLNERTGLLSNESLRTAVQDALLQLQPPIDSSTYDAVFGPQFTFQDDDGIYDADELGVDGLNDVPATNASVESLFYGSLINMFNTFDQIELNQIIQFPLTNRIGSDDFQLFVLEALSDIPLTPQLSEDQLAGLVAREAAILITDLVGDSSIVGVLDHSFLGLAVA